MITLGEYLRGLRLCQTNVSLEKMSVKIGCTKSYLSDVENDKTMPSLAKAGAMQKVTKQA